MKASTYTEYGPPEVLQLREVATPVPKENEVLIRVHATTVNRTDCAMLRAKPFIMRFGTGLFKPKEPILGTDFAGTVESVANKVTMFKVGERVFGLSDSGLHSHAQYMTISDDKGLATIPEKVTFEQAAASVEGAHYAYNMINKVDMKSGQKVLVNGATGAIGSAAVQLSKYYGAHVTAICSTNNLELVRSIGADKVIDYAKEDFTRSNDKYDFIFDTVGKSSFAKCKPLLQPGGVYISSDLGPMIQNPFLAIITPILGGRKVIFPIPFDCARSVRLIKKLIEEGKFRAVIDRQYPLEKIADAFRYVETGEKIGNVVITNQ